MKKVAMIMSILFAVTVASAYAQTQFITPEVTKQLEELVPPPEIVTPPQLSANLLKYKLRKIGVCVNVIVQKPSNRPDGFSVEFTSWKAFAKAQKANIFDPIEGTPPEGDIYFHGYLVFPMVYRTPNVDLIKRQLTIELKLHNIEADISSIPLPGVPFVSRIIVIFHNFNDFTVAISMVLTEHIGLDYGRMYSYEGLPVTSSYQHN